MKNSSSYFENKECEYFPCHKEAYDKTSEHNCMFCFCPLYNMEKCGGDYVKTENGKKDCSKCEVIHYESTYYYVIDVLNRDK